MKVSILGGGSWGTAQGSLLAKKGIEILLWASNQDQDVVLSKAHKTDQKGQFKLNFIISCLIKGALS